MGSVSGLRGHAAAALHHKGVRCRSFVYRKGLGDEYLKPLTYSNATMERKTVLLLISLTHT